VKTSREWKTPPRQILRGVPVTWNSVDTRLSMALVLLEQETCRECGTPSWLGHSADSRIEFKYDVAHCHGCMELEKQRSEASKGRKSDDHGAKPYVYPQGFEGVPLPSRSDEYERRARREERLRKRKAERGS
jgi:hypothetical protein